MPHRSQAPPGFVAPTPVYGLDQADGSVAPARSVAEAAAAVRARVDASAELQGAAGWLRATAFLIDVGLGVGVAFAIATATPMSVAAMVGVAIVATFGIRIVLAALTDGASPGRLITGTRAVDQDGTRLSLTQHATREGFVVAYLALAPVWARVHLERFWMSSLMHLDAGRARDADVPQDRSTGTVVATVAEVARVRAEAARVAALPPRPTPAPASPAGSPPMPAASVPGGTSPHTPPHLGGPGPHSAGPMPAAAPPSPAPAANPHPLAAAPFIPAGPDPDLVAAQQALRDRHGSGGLAVHTMRPPEMGRRLLAAVIDYALIVAIAQLLIGYTGADAVVGMPRLIGSMNPAFIDSIPFVLIGWFLLRPVAMAAVGQTIGQRLMHYRVYAPRGERVGLGKAMLREVAGWGALVVFAWSRGGNMGYATPAHIANADLFEDNTMQARMSHDRLADTWPVRD